MIENVVRKVFILTAKGGTWFVGRDSNGEIDLKADIMGALQFYSLKSVLDFRDTKFTEDSINNNEIVPCCVQINVTPIESISDEDMVLISKEEHDNLVESKDMLNALRGAGVDNWEGYDYAMELLVVED